MKMSIVQVQSANFDIKIDPLNPNCCYETNKIQEIKRPNRLKSDNALIIFD